MGVEEREKEPTGSHWVKFTCPGCGKVEGGTFGTSVIFGEQRKIVAWRVQPAIDHADGVIDEEAIGAAGAKIETRATEFQEIEPGKSWVDESAPEDIRFVVASPKGWPVISAAGYLSAACSAECTQAAVDYCLKRRSEAGTSAYALATGGEDDDESDEEKKP